MCFNEVPSFYAQHNPLIPNKPKNGKKRGGLRKSCVSQKFSKEGQCQTCKSKMKRCFQIGALERHDSEVAFLLLADSAAEVGTNCTRKVLRFHFQ